MSNQDYRIKIEADNSGAVRIIDETGNKLEGLGRTGAGAAGNLSSAFDGLALRVGTFAVGAVAGFVSMKAAIDGVTRGADLDEISKAFQSISGGVDEATVNLNKFTAAADGLLSKADLMKAGSRALLAGIDADQFAELTSLATKLSDIAGESDLSMLEGLTETLAKGSDRALKSIGVYTDLNEKVKEYAASVGLEADQVDEATKRMIFKVEAMEALRAKAAELTGTETNLRDELDRLQSAYTDFKDDIALASAELILHSGIVQEATRWLRELQGVVSAWTPGTIESQMRITSDAIDILEQRATSLKNRLNAPIPIEAFFRGEEMTKELEGVQAGITKLESELLSLSRKNIETGKSNQNLTKTYAEQRKEIEALLAEQGKESKGRDAATKAAKEQEKALAELKKAQEQEAITVMRLTERSDEYNQILDDLANGVATQADAESRISDLYRINTDLVRQLAVAESELLKLTILMAQGADVSAEAFAKAALEVANLKDQIGGLTGAGDGGLTQLQQFGEFALQSLGSSLENALSSLIDGDFSSDDISPMLQSLGADLGREFGKEFGGPIGGAIGSAIGQLAGKGLGKLVDSLFGSDNEGAKARDKVDAYFEDLLDANRISLVIDGQLKEISKLSEESINGAAAYDPFPNLSASAQSQFTNIGMAFEEMFGVMGEIAGQWGNVLANNVGGSLNNLQMLLQGLGVSQEELAEQLENLWLNGDLTAQQYLTSLNQLNDLYTQGIPGAVGATQQAFQNLIDSSGAGRQVLDALGDAAAEAGEKGISTLQGLKEDLIASGADAEKVQQLFDALAKVGITSLEQLKDVGVNASAQIGAELEKTGDFFSDVNAELDDMEERYNKLKDKEVNLTFNVKTNIDKNTAENKDLLAKNGYDYNYGASQ